MAVFPPGGSVDQVARILQPALQQQLGQSVVVDNRGGASGSIGTGSVANGPADGYTFLVGHMGYMGAAPSLYKKLPFDTVKAFEPVVQTHVVPLVLVVSKGVPAKTLPEMTDVKIVQEPIGVCGLIPAWNVPMVMFMQKILPALAAGNAVLIKPAEWTPLTTLRIGELAAEAGLDPDLLQVLTGKGSVVGDRFVTHPGIGKVVFTGSTEVGTQVMAGAAKQIKRVTLELGGKSANIVFDDCDLEKAAATAPYGVFDNAGQDCCARSRILVQRNVYDRFMELLEPAVKGVVVGDPAARDTEMGPLVSRPHWESVAAYVPDDAPIAFRGSAPSGPGYWFAPTVLTPQRTDRTVTEEIFGPVVAVLPFDDEADAIALANATEYGLSGSIWTDNLSRALRVSRAVEAGNLSVNSHSSVRYNTPFGGFKQSGLGRELGPDAPEHFTETKNVFFAMGEA